MAAANGDLIQVIDNQSYLGQQCLNVYYYRVIALLGFEGDYLASINDAFESQVITPILAIQNNQLRHVSREWRNLTNGSDLYVESTILEGTVDVGSAGPMPSFVSAGFLMQRESLVTRNGYKRIAGMAEANVSGNSWVGSPTLLTAIAAGLAADLTVGGFPAVEPVIVKRPIVVPVESYQYASIGSAVFRSIGTQNTRKAGRGV